MKQLKCTDVQSDKECDFVATGQTDDEVIEKMRKHGGETHSDLMKDPTPESIKKWEENARTKITEV